jgi:hypothetical protein
VRKWASANGYQIADRGRVPASVLEAFDAQQAANASSWPAIIRVRGVFDGAGTIVELPPQPGRLGCAEDVSGGTVVRPDTPVTVRNPVNVTVWSSPRPLPSVGTPLRRSGRDASSRHGDEGALSHPCAESDHYLGSAIVARVVLGDSATLRRCTTSCSAINTVGASGIRRQLDLAQRLNDEHHGLVLDPMTRQRGVRRARSPRVVRLAYHLTCRRRHILRRA